MSVSLWMLFGFLAAFFAAVMSLLTEYFKIQALCLAFWLRLFTFLCLSILPFILPWPVDPLFYVFTISASVIFAVSDLYAFGLMAKSGAGIATRLQPLQVAGTFVIWTLITPELAVSYIEAPLRTCGIIASLVAGVYFTLRLRRCEISWGALKIMALPIIAGSIAVIFSKTAMGYAGNLHSGVYYYTYVQAIVVLTVYLIIMKVPALKKRIYHFEFKSRLFDKRVIFAGLCVALLHMCASVTKYYGISLAENPAYVTMLGFTTPLWVLLGYYLVKREEKSDVLSGLAVVGAAACFVFFVQM